MSTRTRPQPASARNDSSPTAGSPPAQARRRRRRRLLVRAGVIGAVAVAALFFVSRGASDSSSAAGGPPFEVGDPGPGAPAPNFTLPSTAGGDFELADQRGKTVLLYFQEGLMCQPCWEQISDIEASWEEFRALGIDKLVPITSDAVGPLQQKVDDEDLRTPILSDRDLALADSYGANQFGMMGTGMYGHSFIVVGPDGTIRWRADYGGEPKYTMYVRPPVLLEDLREGLGQRGSDG